MNKLKLLLHPIRLRIITTLSGHVMTPKELLQHLPDIAQATLYRHIQILYEQEIIEVANEEPVRGAIERYYRLKNPDIVMLTWDDFENASKDELAAYFSAFLTTLMGHFTQYLNGKNQPNIEKDGVRFFTQTVYVDRAEISNLRRQILDFLEKYETVNKDQPSWSLSYLTIPFEEVSEPDE